jgi:hypothetical protein
VVFLSLGTGCLSNEYTLHGSELARLASLPPAERGRSVHVVQDLGERRGPALEPAELPGTSTFDPSWNVDLDVNRGGGATGRGGAPIHARSAGAPRRIGSGGGSIKLGGGGGGGDDLAVVAVVIVAVAVLAAAGLAVTEGIRYDGIVALHPEQPIHLKAVDGGTRTLPLWRLSPAEARTARSAIVKDDEGPGFRFLRRRPLDRRGVAFKVDVGSLDLPGSNYSAAGVASNIQLGYFPHSKVGLLGTLSLGGGSDPLRNTFQRHSANVELQVFPLSWWRLHLGGFFHLGEQVARDAEGTRTGRALGGGGLLELSLTTRLALTGRVDYTAARTGAPEGAWTGMTTFTGGLAIY